MWCLKENGNYYAGDDFKRYKGFQIPYIKLTKIKDESVWMPKEIAVKLMDQINKTYSRHFELEITGRACKKADEALIYFSNK